jgi:hypothetical protein
MISEVRAAHPSGMVPAVMNHPGWFFQFIPDGSFSFLPDKIYYLTPVIKSIKNAEYHFNYI